MLEVFALLGLFIVLTGIIFGISFLAGWASDSDDYSGQWIISTVIAGAFLSLYVFTNTI